MTLETALNEMKEGVGKQFDPAVLDIFLKERLYDSLLDHSPGEKASNLPHSHQIFSRDNHYADNLLMPPLPE